MSKHVCALRELKGVRMSKAFFISAHVLGTRDETPRVPERDALHALLFPFPLFKEHLFARELIPLFFSSSSNLKLGAEELQKTISSRGAKERERMKTRTITWELSSENTGNFAARARSLRCVIVISKIYLSIVFFSRFDTISSIIYELLNMFIVLTEK